MPKVATKSAPKRTVFVSYSHADIGGVRELLKWLKPLCARLFGPNEAWVDYEQLKGGDEWNPKILRALEAADIYIVVMSIDYVNSRFCMSEELPRMMSKRAQGQAQVFGVLLRTVPLENFTVRLQDGSEAGLRQVQCLPQSDQTAEGEHRLGLRAIQTWPGRSDEGWFQLDRQLEAALGTPAVATQETTSPPAAIAAAAPLLTTAAPTANVRLAAHWLPYLANRDHQSMALLESLASWSQTGCRRPLVALTEGRSDDCLPKWVDRLQSYELVKTLGLEEQGQSFGYFKSFAWPAPTSAPLSLENTRQQFQRALANCLGPKPLSPIKDVESAYLTRQRPTLLWVACQDRAEASQALRALDGLLQVLAAWPDLSAVNMLVVAINLERDARASPGERAVLAADFEHALRQAQSAGHIHAAALGSLPELDINHIHSWAQNHAEGSLNSDIAVLFESLPPADRATWPMRVFAEKARHWFVNA